MTANTPVEFRKLFDGYPLVDAHGPSLESRLITSRLLGEN